MTNEGFVKLPRIITERSWFNEPNTLKLYVFLRVNAAFKNIERKDYTVHKGEFVTSISKLSERLGLTVRQIRTALDHLRKTSDITITATSKFSVIALNSEIDARQGDKLADMRADDHAVTRNDNRSSNEKTESKINKMEKAEVPASPAAASHSPNDNTFIGKEELVEKYGAALVEIYENKFRVWAQTKRVVNARLYPTIAKWLAADNAGAVKPAPAPPKPKKLPKESSIDTELIAKRVMESYRKAVQNDR